MCFTLMCVKSGNHIGLKLAISKDSGEKLKRKVWSYLKVTDDDKCISTVKIVPKPKKYGQFVSMYVNRLCSSQPILHHLYSNEYNEYSIHKWILDKMWK